jgi:hypothetical protein
VWAKTPGATGSLDRNGLGSTVIIRHVSTNFALLKIYSGANSENFRIVSCSQFRNFTDTYRRAFANSLGKGTWFNDVFHPSKDRKGTVAKVKKANTKHAESAESDSDTSW